MSYRLYLFLAILVSSAVLVSGCSQIGGAGGVSSTSGAIEGTVVQPTSGTDVSGTIKLMLGEYHDVKPEQDATLEPSNSTEVSSDGTFTIEDIEPGEYYLEATIALNPCFLGAPGQAFNGMMVSFMGNWSPIGISLQNGSSIITGKTEIYEIVAGQPLEVTLELPKCY
jgi:hypothetical protein